MCRTDDLALVVGELIECGAYLERLPGLLERKRDDGVVDVRVRLGAGARLAPIDVDRRPARDRGQPWTQVASRVERLRGSPRLHECLLHTLGSEVAGRQQPHRDSEHRSAVALVDGTHGGFVAETEA